MYFLLFITISTKCYSGKFLENKITVQNKLLPRTAFHFFSPLFKFSTISLTRNNNSHGFKIVGFSVLTLTPEHWDERFRAQGVLFQF